MRSVARTLPFLLAVSLLVAMPEHAGATLGDIWAKGVRYCATTHPNHGTIDGFHSAFRPTCQSCPNTSAPWRWTAAASAVSPGPSSCR